MKSTPVHTNEPQVHAQPTSQASLQSQPELQLNARRTSAQRLLSHPLIANAILLLPMFLVVTMRAPIGSIHPMAVALAATVVTSGVTGRTGVYSVTSTDSHAIGLKRSAAAISMSAALFLLVLYITNVDHDRAWLPLAVVGASVVFCAHRAVVATLTSYSRTSEYFATRIALLGDASAIAQFNKLEHKDPRRVVVQSTHLDTYDDVRPALRKVDKLIDMVHRGEIDRVVVLATAPGLPVVNAVVRRCSMRRVGVDLLTGAARVRPARLELGSMHGFSTVHIRPGLHGRGRVATKRVFDLVVASLALLVLSPLMIVAALAVKLGSRGPVFYRQRRLGRSGQQFEMIKFRSMIPEADQLIVDLTDQNEADGPLFKLKNDPRVTMVGRVIRRTSIDELPQLWNVLRGDMSLVGPRPALAIEADSWPIELFDRLEVAPGITGLWQVSGRSDATFADYERLDLYYVDNWTLGLDVGILLRTVPALLGRGAY